MLYNVLKRMIDRGQTEDLRHKIDVFYAADSLTEEQYEELTGMMESA